MLKSLSVAAILLAASIANAAPTANFDEDSYTVGAASATTNFDEDSYTVGADNSLKAAQPEESQFASKTVITSNVPVYVKKSSKSKKSEEASDSEPKKTKTITAFRSKHKKWLKSTGDAEAHLVTLMRQKPTHKDGKKLSKKEKKKAKKSKKAVVNNTLNVKTKDSPIKITVVTEAGLKKGINVYDDGVKLFKTTKKNYAVVGGGSHSFSLESNHSKTSNAQVTLEKMKAKKIADKFYVVSTPVAFEDAQNVCEMFGGNLANLSVKDLKKVMDKAEKFTKKEITQVWIEQFNGEEGSTPSVIPQLLSLKSGEVNVDPDNIYTKAMSSYLTSLNELAQKKESEKLSKKKFKRALKKIQKKTRKEMDKVKITKATYQAPVLCKL